jgi:hypothetical protein
MYDDPLIDVDLLRDLDPNFFTTCGRALYVTQHFERNLRVVAAALDVRSAHASGKFPSLDENTLNEFFETKLKRPLGEVIISGLSKHIPQFLIEDFKKHMLPSLDKAREARNRIAHEFLFGIERMEVASDVFEEMVESLREDVRILADADFSVCCIIQGFNRAPIPTCRESYVNKIVSWVFAPNEQYQQGD